MGSSRSLVMLTVLLIGTVFGGQAIFTRIPLEQVLQKTRDAYSSSRATTVRSDDSVIPMQREGGVWLVTVELNEFTETKLIVDTGATYTTISEDLAFDAGVQSDPNNSSVTLFTAGGNVKAKVGIATNIRVGHAERDEVHVVIHTIPNLPDGVDGLLGLSFFDQFMVRLDHSQRELHLTPKT